MIASALEIQYELMSYTVMYPSESAATKISLLGSVAKAGTVVSSSQAAWNLPANTQKRKSPLLKGCSF